MSLALFEVGGLRTWEAPEIAYREFMITEISRAVEVSLRGINRAWTFHRIEAPSLVALDRFSDSYTDSDIFELKAQMADKIFCLRPETTPTSYEYARRLLNTHKPPFCVWQAGKSFRRELSDGASASKLRFNEFWQLEFQSLYSVSTKADYRIVVQDALIELLSLMYDKKNVRLIPSDRLPAYSKETNDLELYDEKRERWFEVASLSSRTDFHSDIENLEIAFGLDRLVEIKFSV